MLAVDLAAVAEQAVGWGVIVAAIGAFVLGRKRGRNARAAAVAAAVAAGRAEARAELAAQQNVHVAVDASQNSAGGLGVVVAELVRLGMDDVAVDLVRRAGLPAAPPDEGVSRPALVAATDNGAGWLDRPAFDGLVARRVARFERTHHVDAVGSAGGGDRRVPGDGVGPSEVIGPMTGGAA